jgi:small multidrug resistance pump
MADAKTELTDRRQHRGKAMTMQLNANVALAVAIVLEVTATTHLQMSEQLTKLSPTVIMALCYGASFYFLSIALKTMPIGIAYAVWSALGIVLISAIGYVKFRQVLDTPGMIGVALIVLGVIIANVFSKSVAH